MTTTFAVIAETEQGELTGPTLECVEEAREVADGIGARVVAILPAVEAYLLASTLGAHGADLVILVEHEALCRFSADGWILALEPVLAQEAPAFVLAPDSGRARSWMPKMALIRGVPLVSGCLRFRARLGGTLEITRSCHGGAIHERLACSLLGGLFLTLRPGVRGIGSPSATRRCEVIRLRATLDPNCLRDRTVGYLPPDPKTVDISEAERIVAGGLGVSGLDGMDLLNRLAEQLAAAVGGTRPLVDLGLLPLARQIGVTGKMVAPRLFLALGISGASQHTSGMTGSETVIVVNDDPTAPMFALADLGVVGDLHEVVPALLKELEMLE